MCVSVDGRVSVDMQVGCFVVVLGELVAVELGSSFDRWAERVLVLVDRCLLSPKRYTPKSDRESVSYRFSHFGPT